jgi:hypothetical protein
MPSDEVLVALINESVTAKDRYRRVAALVLLEVLRSGRDVAAPVSGPDIIPAEDAVAVADEIAELTSKYQLGGPDPAA